MKKIIITGGHVTPALAVIDVLSNKKWQIYYIGRKYALEGDLALSQESQLIKEKNIPFLTLTTGRLQRKITPYTLISLLKIPIGFAQSLFYLVMVRPHVILSFGGYVALPVVLVSWILAIPVITHEQTFSPGLANKIISIFAKKICISWDTTYGFFPKNKTVLTGNPVRKELFSKTAELDIPKDRPLIFITGGNLGAHSITVVVEKMMDELVKKYTVIHQCGNALEFKDYQRLQERVTALSPMNQKRYFVYSFINTKELSWLFNHADLLISRSGANIVTEIIYSTIPSILIPLPWAGANEQEKNAQFLANCGAAILLNQKNVTPQLLMTTITHALKQSKSLKEQLEKIKTTFPSDPAMKILDVIESVA